MKTAWQLGTVLVLSGCLTCVGQSSRDIDSPQHKGWDMLQNAVTSKRVLERSEGARALGLLPENALARATAEELLKDPKPEVRVAAASALGQMHATESIPKLTEALQDHNIPVVMAAATALRELKDPAPANEMYYELLTGERKAGDGLIKQQLATLKNPKELAKIGFSQGIGYIPFAGIGWDAYRTIHKKDPNPVRAVAATYLAHDPDPATTRALVRAMSDKDSIVRAAAIQAIAERGDPSLIPKVELKLSDRHTRVRYSAAAAVVRLSAIEQDRKAENKLETR